MMYAVEKTRFEELIKKEHTIELLKNYLDSTSISYVDIATVNLLLGINKEECENNE